MKINRKKENLKDLCSGPGKLVIALELKKEHNKIDLTESKNLYLCQSDSQSQNSQIVKTKRIGISKGINLPHRFYIKDNKFISKP